MGDTIKGTEFDYRIDTEHGINHDGFIAEGTESIVFKGIKYGNDLRYSCALKFKPISRLNDFMNREYKILESMQTCRSVVRVLDVIEDLGDFSIRYKDGQLSAHNCFCVVEEFIDGDSLQDYCIKQWFQYDPQSRRWTRNSTEYEYREIVKYQNQIVQFMINLCEIMKFVSNVNADNGKTESNKPIVLHCDIKPENIMVTKHGKELVLIDFGRSQELMDSRTYQHYNNPEDRTFIANYGYGQWQDKGKENFYAYGTVGYAAPECYAGQSKSVTTKNSGFPFPEQKLSVNHGLISIESDIFGFGTTFWECLSIYEICMDILKHSSDTSSPRFFNKAILKKYEDDVHEGRVKDYCNRDFRKIDIAYHESLEAILKKCTCTRKKGFQYEDHSAVDSEYYHNFYSLQDDLERARDIIPALDRKSDPLVRQMVGVSGFCSAFTICFFALFIILIVLSNSLSLDKWENLKSEYTDNQVSKMRDISNEMMNVPFRDDRYENLDEIIRFMHSGAPNDDVFDQDEAAIIADLLKDHVSDQSKWIETINTIMQNPKTDNIDGIVKTIYNLNLSKEYSSDGYELAKAIYEVNNYDDLDKLISAYNTALKYQNKSKYKNSVSKLSAKLLTGKKIDKIADDLGENREDIRNKLRSLT